MREERDVKFKDLNSEYYYKAYNNLDLIICIILTYDISNSSS